MTRISFRFVQVSQFVSVWEMEPSISHCERWSILRCERWSLASHIVRDGVSYRVRDGVWHLTVWEVEPGISTLRWRTGAAELFLIIPWCVVTASLECQHFPAVSHLTWHSRKENLSLSAAINMTELVQYLVSLPAVTGLWLSTSFTPSKKISPQVEILHSKS